MPQDSLRSIVYRSFVVCDDPKGVVESGMIRRSESDSRKMEHKNEGRKAQNRLDVCVASKAGREETVSKGPMEELHSSSSCQLLEVSRGAHKLNQVTNSWSGGIWCDRHSKDLAKDLLKGALELQDSLHMLGKLQEASHLARLKKKEKEKSDKVRNDQVIQGMHLSSVEERNYRKAIQNPHLSAGVSSRDCIEELREVIRDSLARQNLLPNINAEEKRCFSSRYPLDSASDVPSTSSSRSSSVQTDNFTSMESSIWSAAEEKKARGPSLIAKLMGLEEMPPKSWKTNSQKDTENKKIFSQQRPAFEIDTPKVRKPQYALRTEDPEKPLKDVLETMHFKVLLKSNSIKEIKPDSYQSSDFFSGSRLINNSPPIVLIKPRHDPYLQPEEKFARVLQEEGSSNRETMLKKPKAKEDSPSKIIDSNNRGLNFSKTSRRLETKETPVKRHIQQEGAKDSRENKTRPARKEVKTKQSLSTRVKSSGSITQSSLKKVATEKNIDMIPKPMISSRKPFEKEVPKPKNLLRSKVQAKVAPQKSSKPENASNVMKSKVSHQPSATANSNSARKPQTIVRGPVDLKKSSTKKATEKIECKADQRIDPASENDTNFEEYSSATSDQLPREEGAEHIDIQIGEHCSESSVFDVTLVTFGDQNSRKSIEVDDDLITSIGTDCESFMTGTSLKALLLSSPAFINNVEELFDLCENVPTTLQKIGISGFSDADTRLSLDCANEIVRRRSNPDSQMIHPPWFSLVGNAKRHISLDHLLKETCDRVEALRSYSEVAGKNYPADSLYSMLERDINHSEVLSGIWDLGWRKGFSVDDTIQVVEDIEKQLLSGLIAEICA
ncbi:hypothetical protein V6Z11_D06G072700 [Gossypium hirsutum]